jgi:AAA family ATP:ADP antiporter
VNGGRASTRTAVLVCALALTLLFGYAVIRPASESLFLWHYGPSRLPMVWVAVAVVAVVVVAAYSRAVVRWSLGTVMVGAIVVSAATFTLLLLLVQRGIRPATFWLYVWKDVHVVVLIEALWSFAHLVFATKTARWAYGVFCAAGSLGGMAGNLTIGALAERWGTATAVWLLLPLFALDALLVVALARSAGSPARADATTRDRPAPPRRSNLALLRESRYLGWLLVLIAVVQVVITLIDFSYNSTIEAAYPHVDERTAVIGRIYAGIDALSLLFQLASGVVLRFVGVRATLLAIPALVGMALATFVAAPRTGLIVATKMASKVFDYSLFRAAKEMLYLPLDYDEKTRGKAIIDVLGYRVAKGGASLLLMLLVGASVAADTVTLVLIVAWFVVALVVTRRHAKVVAHGGAER